MKKQNKFFAFLLRPNFAFLVGLYVLTVALLSVTVAILLVGDKNSPAAYSIYVVTVLLSAYAIYTAVVSSHEIKAKAINVLIKTKFTTKMMKNYRFRAIVYASISGIVSTGYAIFNAVMGWVSQSVWFGALAAYYFILALLRGGVIFSQSRTSAYKGLDEKAVQVRKLKLHRNCGIMLISTILALSVAIMQMVVVDKSFQYAGLMIYAGAAYTFSKVVISIVSFVKARKRKDVIVESIKNINLADAAVSVLALQTAMFQSFAAGQNMGYANAATGAVVCCVIFGLGVFMIVSATVKLKKLKEGLL